MNKILIYEVEEMIDGIIGLMQTQDIEKNDRAKHEVIIEVDTLTQATQIVSYILGEYEEIFENVSDIEFYESYSIGEKSGGSYYFKLDGRYWSVGHNSLTSDMMAELSDSDTLVLDLRTMVW